MIARRVVLDDSLWYRPGIGAYSGMRACSPIVVVFAGLLYSVGSAWAGPGVIVGTRVEVFTAPSVHADVAAELGGGAAICVLDASNYPGVVMQRLGWLAIRIPAGVGYVPVETVDLSAPAPEVHDCGKPTSEPTDLAPAQSPAPDREPPPRRASGMTALRPRLQVSEPVAAVPPPLTTARFVPPLPARLLMGMGTGRAQLNERSAAAHRIGDAGATLNGTLGVLIWDVFTIASAFSFVFPGDDAAFSQQVVPEIGGGDPRTANSSLTIVSYSLAAGPRTPFWALGLSDNGWVATALFAEYGIAGASGTRSITDCVDCREDDLEMPGGTFWRVGVDLLVPSRRPTFSYGLTISYQRYAADAGFGNEIRIALSGWVHSAGKGRAGW
jgi:hypothetical protein